MADKRITELSPIVTISSGDVFPIVDISDNTTKKIDITQIKAQSPVQSVAGKTGTVVLDASDIGAGTVDNTEFGYLNGVTSAIQTQLNAKQNTLSLTTTGTSGAATLVGDTLNIPQYSGGGGVAWGGITGTLSAQTDLQTALDGKVDENAAITAATKTKITYDVKGLVTAGADATTADIADSTNKRYVTDANLTVIGNTSGTNSGNQTLANTSDATSHTATLSATGGSVKLVEGSGITLTTTGTSADGIITIASTGGGSGTVTSVAALTLGTTGTDLSSTVANGTTTPVITLNVPSANVSNRGVLTAADWINFNSKQASLVSGTNIKTINSTSILGSGNLVVSGVPSGVSGAIQFSNGSAFTSDATNFFWDDANNRLGIGINTPSASLHVKGIGTTSGTTTIKITNSSSEDLLKITDDGNIQAVGFRVNPGNAAQGELVAGTSIDTYSPTGGARSMSFLASPGAPGTMRTQFGSYFNGGWYSQLDILNNQSGVTADVYMMQSGLGNLGIRTNNPKAPVHIGGSPTANANFGTLSLGTPAAFDGATANKFAGNANGTFIATNRTSGSASHIDCQNNGVSVFEVTDSGVGTFNTSSPDVSAQLQVDSTTKGFLMPRMTTTQRDAIATPATGLSIYNTTTNSVNYYNGTAWEDTKLVVTNRQTVSYTLAITDANKLVEINNASANNLTVPLNSSVAYSIGTQILLAQYGAGQTTVVATSGVTIRSSGGKLKLNVQYSGATLIKIATDEWYLFGDITT